MSAMIERDGGGRRWIWGLALVLAAASFDAAHADRYHYNNIRIGDRASGMGGAYIAVSDDTSGLYYNPAGTAYAQTRNLSGSVNAYHTTSTTYRDVGNLGDWERTSSTLVPNFFGIVQPLGEGTLGFSYVVTDAVNEDQDQTFLEVGGAVDDFVINLNNEENTYKVGPSYARELAPGLSLGATLYLHVRNQETMSNQTYTFDDPAVAPEWFYQQTQTDEVGMEPVLGLMWSPVDRLALGLTLRRPLILTSDSYAITVCHTASAASATALCPEGNIRWTSDDSGTKREYPWQLGLGLAWFASQELLLAADLNYYTEVDDPLEDRTLEATWNLAVGLEYYLTPGWALRAGLFSNRANTPGDAGDFESLVTQYEHVDYTGGSVSVTRFTRTSSLTAGVSHAIGSGEASVIAGTVSDVDATATTFFLSTTYSY